MKNDILTLSKALISVPSVKSEQLNEVLNIAVSPLEGFAIERFEKNGVPSILAYKQSTRPDKFKVIFNAHLDVVSGNDGQFTPREEGGKLVGRGAIDMKAAAAVEILLFKELSGKLSYPIGLQLVTDEEIGGFRGTKYQIEEGVQADFVIAGEPTNFGINNKAKGVLWIKIKSKGVTGHGAYPWKGENAVLKMTEFIGKLYKSYPLPDKESWQTTFNLSRIENTNQTFNKIPDDCTSFFDIRFIPEEADSIVDNIKKMLPEGFELEVVEKESAQFTDEKNQFVDSLKTSIEKITRKQPEIIVKHGASDIRHFNQVGIEGITFGPIGDGLHSDNEWVDIKSLETYYLILNDFLVNLS